MLIQLEKDIKKLADPKQAEILKRFFKTGPGQYGEGDQFIGIKVPRLRLLSKKYNGLPLTDLKKLLRDPVHEKRMLALFIMVGQIKNADETLHKKLYDLYLANTKYINNWDLVDLTAPQVIGENYRNYEPGLLFKLAKSKLLWERRIAMLACFYHIKNKEPKPALEIAELLRHDDHDLMQKAVGWMLREIGKRCSPKTEEEFLKKYYRELPRTMLRYAIERFPEKLRQGYLKGEV